MMRLWLPICALLLVAGLATADTTMDDVARTWDGALIYAPGAEGPRKMASADLPEWLSGHPETPVVVYAHGCDGISKITRDTGLFLAGTGYVFVAPDSFARRNKPKSCDPATHRSSLHREVLAWRQAEVDRAIGAVREVTDAPIALMGHSEGAITAATYQGRPLHARIIEGWTCHAGWPEYRGLNAPAAEPVLALLGSRDPWFRAAWARGDCGSFMDANDTSIVYEPPGYLHTKHWLSFDRDVRRTIGTFLDTHMKAQ